MKEGVLARAVPTALLAGGLYAGCYVLVTTATSFGTTTAGSTFWPGAGITLGFLLRGERRSWPAVVLAVGLAEGALDLAYGFPPLVAASWAVANTCEALGGAVLLRRRDDRPRFDLGPLPLFLAAGVLAGPVLGATIGTLSAALLAGDEVWPRLARWFVGDAIGVLVVAPLVVQVRTRRRDSAPAPWGWQAAVVGAAVVGLGPWDATARWGLPFLVLAFVLVVSVRFNPREAAWATLVVALTVETVTALGSGPFVHSGPFQGLVVAQMFVAACSVAALVVSSLVADVVSRDALAQALRAQAHHDPLTGAGNRRLLEASYPRACAVAGAQGELVGVLAVDLDGFKQVNDRFGHDAGDRVLIETAHRLRAAVRDTDTVVRLGGDEFVVLLEPVESAAAAETLAERSRAFLSQPVPWQDRTLRVTASVGAATADPAGSELQGLLRQADAAMYLAKRSVPRPRAADPPVVEAEGSPSP